MNGDFLGTPYTQFQFWTLSFLVYIVLTVTMIFWRKRG